MPRHLNRIATFVVLMLSFASVGPIHVYATRARQAVDSPQSRQFALAAGSTVKILVKRDGWYRVSANDLKNAGIDRAVNPAHLQLFAGGREIPMNVDTTAGGARLAAIEFYGTGLNVQWTDTRVYWLITGTHTGKRIATLHPGPGTGSAAPSFLATVESREHLIYAPTVLNGDAENYFGQIITSQPVTLTLRTPELDTSSTVWPTLKVSIQGLSITAHSVDVALNGHHLGSMAFNDKELGVKDFILPQSALQEGDNAVALTPPGTNGELSLVQSLRLSYLRLYHAQGDTVRFIAAGRAPLTLSGFSSSHIRVFDITQPDAVTHVAATIHRTGSTYNASLTSPGSSGETENLLAIGSSIAASPAAIVRNHPSRWHTANHKADLVIIAYHDFLKSTASLTNLHKKQGLAVQTIDVQDLYDEFSFGTHSPQAIHDFLQWTTTHWQRAPRYVLLVGSASYDPKNYQGKGNLDFVPTKLIDTTSMETASDEWLVDFRGDGTPSMAIGRLPVRTVTEANTEIAKIVNWSPKNEQPSAVLAADTPHPDDTMDFADTSDSLATLFPSTLSVQKVYRGTANDNAIHDQLLSAINAGPLFVNYVGHGTTDRWSGAQLLSDGDAPNLTNGSHLPMVVAMTCLTGYFISPTLVALGPALLSAPNGGAVAVWSSTGQTTPEPQAVLNRALYQSLFAHPSIRIGDAIASTIPLVGDGDVRRTWIFFGDPTMRMDAK